MVCRYLLPVCTILCQLELCSNGREMPLRCRRPGDNNLSGKYFIFRKSPGKTRGLSQKLRGKKWEHVLLVAKRTLLEDGGKKGSKRKRKWGNRDASLQ